jgi:hypothetical protein
MCNDDGFAQTRKRHEELVVVYKQAIPLRALLHRDDVSPSDHEELLSRFRCLAKSPLLMSRLSLLSRTSASLGTCSCPFRALTGGYISFKTHFVSV